MSKGKQGQLRPHLPPLPVARPLRLVFSEIELEARNGVLIRLPPARARLGVDIVGVGVLLLGPADCTFACVINAGGGLEWMVFFLERCAR